MNHRDSHDPTAWAAALSIVTYLLSPFPVTFAVSRMFDGLLGAPPFVADCLQFIYAPLLYAADRWPWVGDFYGTGFDLMDVW